MDAAKCEAFLYAAEGGSFTAAAERMDYTQSGITRMVGSLENELGFTLFVRSKKGVALTENGKEMVPLMRDIVSAHETAEQRSREIRGVYRGTVNIGSYFAVSAMWMPEILKAFGARYPGIKVRLREGGNAKIFRWLRERSADCCFCAEPDAGTADWIPLCRDEMVAWLPLDHPMAGARSYPPRMLANEHFIHTDPGEDTDQDRLLEKWNVKPDTKFTTRDGFAIYNMVAKGLGVSFNQRLISKDWHGAVALVPFDPPEYVTLGIAVPSLKECSPAAKKFIETAREIIFP